MKDTGNREAPEFTRIPVKKFSIITRAVRSFLLSGFHLFKLENLSKRIKEDSMSKLFKHLNSRRLITNIELLNFVEQKIIIDFWSILSFKVRFSIKTGLYS